MRRRACSNASAVSGGRPPSPFISTAPRFNPSSRIGAEPSGRCCRRDEAAGTGRVRAEGPASGARSRQGARWRPDGVPGGWPPGLAGFMHEMREVGVKDHDMRQVKIQQHLREGAAKVRRPVPRRPGRPGPTGIGPPRKRASNGMGRGIASHKLTNRALAAGVLVETESPDGVRNSSNAAERTMRADPPPAGPAPPPRSGRRPPGRALVQRHAGMTEEGPAEGRVAQEVDVLFPANGSEASPRSACCTSGANWTRLVSQDSLKYCSPCAAARCMNW